MGQTVDRAVGIAADADRVWEFVSSSEGLSGWFVDATVVPGPEGSVTLRFAPGAEGTVPVLAWEPPHRIRFGIPDGGRAHEISVTATSEGCQVRVLDEGVSDAEAAATATGWEGYLGRLRALAEAAL